MKTRTWGLVVASAFAVLAAAAPVQATVTLNFSDFSSDSTPASDLNATVSFTASGNQLQIDINNLSAFDIAQLYFNTGSTVAGLSAPANSNFTVSGSGDEQTLSADGMGRYNWLVDFGSGDNRLGAGTTSLTLDLTPAAGATDADIENAIISTFSENPPGKISALGVLKFESGPNDDSAFGGSETPGSPPPPPPPVNEIPAPATLLFACVASGLGLVGYTRRRTREKKSAAPAA